LCYFDICCWQIWHVPLYWCSMFANVSRLKKTYLSTPVEQVQSNSSLEHPKNKTTTFQVFFNRYICSAPTHNFSYLQIVESFNWSKCNIFPSAGLCQPRAQECAREWASCQVRGKRRGRVITVIPIRETLHIYQQNNREKSYTVLSIILSYRNG